MNSQEALIEVVLSLGDDHLILGHRLSEWCGHAPMLEEDLSMPNMALDLIGQARNLYTYAGELEARGRNEDDFAYLRTDREYRNLLLVERPNGDFAHTMLRQFYFAAFMHPYWQAVLEAGDSRLQEFAGKAVKEMAYHIRHTGEWIIRLGDGTDKSAARMRAAVEALHIYTDEMFAVTPAMRQCIDENLTPDPQIIRDDWDRTVDTVFTQAMLSVPEIAFPQEGGRVGRHTEDFGHLLADLQYMQRTFPGVQW